MVRIQLYTTAWCGFCSRAKALLEEHELPYEEIRLDDDPSFRASLLDLTGRWTVPQILIDGKMTLPSLYLLERRGLLDGLAA